jgi:hypothetical protein
MSCHRSLQGCLRRSPTKRLRFRSYSGRVRSGAAPRNMAKTISASLFVILLFAWAATPFAAASKDKDQIAYGEGLIVNLPLPAAEVEQVVQDVAQNGLIRGTKEYNKDQYISGAKAADSSHVFPAWDQEGKAFYKVRDQAIDPRNFKDSNDVGTLAVRYVVQPQGKKNTVLRIDAIFEEDFRHVVHLSNGSVETAEYNDIREHLDSIEVMKGQDLEAQRLRTRKRVPPRIQKTPPRRCPQDRRIRIPDQAFLTTAKHRRFRLQIKPWNSAYKKYASKWSAR